MRQVRKKDLPEFCVRLRPSSYARICAISMESRRPVEELLEMAIAVFATSIANVQFLHPPKLSQKPLSKKTRSAISPVGQIVKAQVDKLKKGV